MDSVIPLRGTRPDEARGTRPDEGALPAVVSETIVRLDGLRLMAAVGVNRCEIGRRQPLVIWTELGLEHGSGGGIDRLEQTVDYRAIAMAASDLAATHIDLIETFAHRLAERCMAMPVAGGRVAWARVRLDKPEAVDNGLASVSVHLRAR